ncbi:MAG: polyprenyl diphosphate synthase [Candidatus Roizmanbacteria bacterium]|nr:polyprenyl diphosphate synthase [Candidatus Roizmanbacteria bacterium]
MELKNIPNHIAIIADGNRRWAKERNLPSFEGHRKGFENIKALSSKAKKLGIQIVTFWVFSTENWKRAADEVGYLMNLAEKVIDVQVKEAIQEETRIVHIGRKDRLPEGLKKKIANAEERTKEFSKYFFVIALDYGGQDEIMRAVQKMKDVKTEKIDDYLDTHVLPYPNPDLIIRTSGEIRLSGFMTWQSAYSEYFFSDLYFPDFGPEALEKSIIEYSDRQRRFGK